MRLRSKVSMAGPNFSVQPNQEFEFENEAQIQRWLAAGYVEVVEIPGGRRLENAGTRIAAPPAPATQAPATPSQAADPVTSKVATAETTQKPAKPTPTGSGKGKGKGK